MPAVRVSVLAALVVFGLPAGAAAQRGVAVDRVDVALRLLEDGSLLVHEAAVVRVIGTREARYERRVGLDRADALIDVSARVEGEPAASVEIRRAPALRVRWRLPASDVPRVLHLEYRAIGVVEVAGEAGRLVWTVVPGRRDHATGSVRLTVQAPPGAWMHAPAIEGVAGWVLRREDDRWIAGDAGLARGEGVTLAADLALDALRIAVPDWQAAAERGRMLRPAFVAAAGFFLVIGFGSVWMVRLQYPRAVPVAAPPAEGPIAPALAVALARGRPSMGGREALAAFLGLVHRGALPVEAGETADPRGRDLVVRVRLDDRADVLPHERVILDDLWLGAKHGGVPLKTAARRLGRLGRRFGRVLETDLADAGLLSRDRARVARGWLLAGAASAFLAAGCTVFVAVVLWRYGPWPMAVPASLGVVSVLYFGAGLRFAVLTDRGAAEAAAWRARARAVRRVAAGRDEPPAGEFARWLPLAAGLRVAPRWLRRFRPAIEDGREPVPWAPGPASARTVAGVVSACAVASSARA